MYRLIVVLIVGTTAVVSAFAQTQIAYVAGDTPDAVEKRRETIVQNLGKLGLNEKRDFILTAQTFAGNRAELPKLAASTVAAKPSMIFAGSWDVANELKKHTTTIPIVFAARADLESPNFRIVDNLSAPEANLTGFTRYINLVPKRLQSFKEAFPAAKKIGFVHGVDMRAERISEYAEAAKKVGIELSYVKFRKEDLSKLADALNARSEDGFLVALDDLLTYNRAVFLEQLPNVKKPVMHPEEAADKGVHMHLVAVFDAEAKAAEYLAKLMRGAKVRDLAIQEPQVFDFAVNLPTMRRHGLALSRDALTRARRIE